MTTTVLGPAPCTTCGAWVEWLGAGPWVALGTATPHDCGPYLQAQPTWHAHPLPPELPLETWRLLVALLLVAAFFALAGARYAAGLL